MRRLQIFISLTLIISGSVISAYYTAQVSARRDCDNRYTAFVRDLDKQGDLSRCFLETGHGDFYSTRFKPFHPSGWKFSYAAPRECELFMIGGGAVALLGIAGILDTYREKKITRAL